MTDPSPVDNILANLDSRLVRMREYLTEQPRLRRPDLEGHVRLIAHDIDLARSRLATERASRGQQQEEIARMREEVRKMHSEVGELNGKFSKLSRILTAVREVLRGSNAAIATGLSTLIDEGFQK